MKKLRILIADDHGLVRRGARAVLHSRPGWRVVGEAANGREVATPIGPIAIAPAVAPWLKDAPLSFETQEQFLRFAASVIQARPADLGKGVEE